MKFARYTCLLCFFFAFVKMDAKPVATCNDGLAFNIDLDGTVLVVPEMIGKGIDDSGAVVTLSFSKDIYDVSRKYDCNDLEPGTFELELWVQNVLGEMDFCSTTIQIVDSSPPVITGPPNAILNCWDDFNDLAITGKATATDHCLALPVTFEDTEELDCGAGLIIRTWTATDPSGNTATCTQSITLERSFSEVDIIWPERYNILDCESFDAAEMPDGFSYPSFEDDACVSLHATYEDMPRNCGYMERYWTVIDSCTYDSLNNSGIWTYTQFLSFDDKISPVITKKDIAVCLDDNACDSAEVVLKIEVTDNCFDSTGIQYIYALDISYDGSTEISGYNNGDKVLLPAGDHLISWQANDKCQNLALYEQMISVLDCTPPVVVPAENFEAALLTDVSGADLDAGSSDNCANLEFLLQYPSLGEGQKNIPASAVFNLLFDCKHIDAPQYVDLWVIDDAGNASYAIVAIQVIDKDNVCS